MALRAALLVALLVAPLAAGQLPSSPPSAGVRVTATPQAVQVGLDEPVTVQVVVTNTATATGTPFDRPRLVTLGRSDPPPGWTASIAPTEFQLAPGQSGNATLTLAVSGDADAREATVTVTARMYPMGVNQVPGVGPQVDPETTGTTAVQARRDDSLTRGVLETVGSSIWLILLGAVAAIVLAGTVLAANRRVAVRLHSPEAEKSLPAGGRVAFPLRVHNLTRQDDTVHLRAANLPDGWAAYLPTPQLDLGPGQQEEVSVVVVAPKQAAEGDRQDIDVTATSTLAPRRPATVRLQASVAPRRPGSRS